MRISDWSSDVCSSDLQHRRRDDPARQGQRRFRQDEERRRRAVGDRIRPMTLDAQKAFSGTVAPEGADVLDEARLTAWMEANVEGFEGPLTQSKFAGGQSNPTYKISAPRSEERRVGKEGVSTGRSRRSAEP